MDRRRPRLVKQAAVVPFRVRDGSVELCLITTMRERRWSVPKGLIDPGHTSVDTALNEALEEAGLRGEIVGPPLGSYEYEKWGMRLTVEVHLMRVTDAADMWLEMHARDRRWAPAPEAKTLLADHPAAELIDIGIARASEDA